MKELDFNPGYSPPILYLALSEKEFEKIVSSMGISLTSVPPWAPQSGGRAHMFEREKGGLAAIVTLNGTEGSTGIQIAALLAHESVHIWQDYVDHIGEKSPGREQEAYFIQNCLQALLTEYARRR